MEHYFTCTSNLFSILCTALSDFIKVIQQYNALNAEGERSSINLGKKNQEFTVEISNTLLQDSSPRNIWSLFGAPTISFSIQ